MRRLKDAPRTWVELALIVEAKPLMSVSSGVPVSVKGGVEEFFLRVVGMVVAALGVGLPELDHRVAHRSRVTVENATLDLDTVAARLRRDK